MSDQGRDNSPSPSPTSDDAAPQPSLREIAETAYDDVVDAADADEPSEGGQDQRVRDSLGRFVAADRDKPGEQSTDPAPKEIPGTQPKTPEPAPAGSSTQAPEHWSAELKADFAKLQPEGKAILLHRHREMEADYTRKSQASAGAVQFANALEPVFTDPDISRAMQEAGFNAVQAIHDWGGMFKRAMSPQVRDRIGLLVEMSERMGLDPARLFATASNRPEPELSDEDMNDPAIRYFADKLGRLTNDHQAVQHRLDNMLRQEAENRQQETVKGFLWHINAFGDEKDGQGNLTHPYLDNPAVMATLHEMFAANPKRDLKEAYEAAVWANAETRAAMLEAERRQLFGQNSADRARAALRGNTRGITSPVAKPNSAANGKGGLRGALESSADEIGF